MELRLDQAPCDMVAALALAARKLHGTKGPSVEMRHALQGAASALRGGCVSEVVSPALIDQVLLKQKRRRAVPNGAEEPREKMVDVGESIVSALDLCRAV